LECLETGEATIVDIDLSGRKVLGAGMPCGGRMRFSSIGAPRPQLWLMGHFGRIAEALCTWPI